MGLKLRTLYILLGIFIVILVTGITLLIVNYLAPSTTTDTSYKLTHTAADAEYILSWDSIVSRCPAVGTYDKQEFFVYRGESAQTIPGAPVLNEDSPAAWSCLRGVRTEIVGNSFRSFGVWMWYFETDEYLNEHIQSMQTSGFPVQEDGDFVTGVLESGPPTQSVQLLLAGKHFAILFMDIASSDESLFFGKEKLMELLPTVKSNISSLEITPLPTYIPERIVVEDTYEWQEFINFRSDELSPPVRVPEEEHYNDLIFSDRPLMQVFNFVIDKDWRFVMTSTGEIDTRFEVYITVKSSGEEGFTYSSDQVFSLYSETVNITREQPIERGYQPPFNIEVKVLFDSPISWVMTIEK